MGYVKELYTFGTVGAPRRRVFKKRYTKAGNTTVAKQVKKILNDPKNKEYKYIDTAVGSCPVDGTWAITLLNGCQQGDTATTREGQSTTIKSIQVYGTIADDVALNARWMLVYDKQPNGEALTMAEVLTLNGINKLKNLANKHRFIILKDSRKMGTSEAFTSDPVQYIYNLVKYYKKHNLPVTYNTGTAGDITDINTGSLYFCISGKTANATTYVTDINCRVRFVE